MPRGYVTNPPELRNEVPVYPMHDQNSCAVTAAGCAIAFFEPQARWNWAELDRAVGRAPGECASIGATALYMLDRGYRQHSISPFNTAQYLAHGLSYLEQVNDIANADPAFQESFYAYFTPERLRADMAEAAANDRVFQNHPAYSEETRVPGVADILNLLQQRFLVMAAVGFDKTSFSSHEILITGYYRAPRGHVMLEWYDPDPRPEYVFIGSNTLEMFRRGWQPDEGILGIRKP
jgi:hypothetical protein